MAFTEPEKRNEQLLRDLVHFFRFFSGIHQPDRSQPKRLLNQRLSLDFHKSTAPFKEYFYQNKKKDSKQKNWERNLFI